MKTNRPVLRIPLLSVLLGLAPAAFASPEILIEGLGNGGFQDLGEITAPPADCSKMTPGNWYGSMIKPAEKFQDITPPEGSQFILFGNPKKEGELSTISQRFEISPDIIGAALEGRATLLASFQVNLPPKTYAKGRAKLISLDAKGNKLQEEIVASFRPDHLPSTWETIHLRDFSGLDLATKVEVDSIILEIGFTADYPDDADDFIALIDDVEVVAHLVSNRVRVDTDRLSSDGLACVTGSPENDLAWGRYHATDQTLEIFDGANLVETISTTNIKRLQVYMGAGNDAFFIVDAIGSRFADLAVTEVYLHSGNDLGAASITLNKGQFDDLDEIFKILTEIQKSLSNVRTQYQVLATDHVTGLLGKQVAPRAAEVLSEGYEKQVAFKTRWESTHQPIVEQKIAELKDELTHLEILLECHESQMESILSNEEKSEYDSPLETLEEEWEAAIDAIEEEWEAAEFALSDENSNDAYDQNFPEEGTSLTPETVEIAIAELEERIENLDDAIDRDEDIHEELRENHISKLEQAFLIALDNRIAGLRSKAACLEELAELAGDESTGEVVTMLAPYISETELAVENMQAAVQKELQQILAEVGQISPDKSANNNFGRASLRGNKDEDGPANTDADTNPDELGQKVFGIVEQISDLIDRWGLPDDKVAKPVPLDCSSGAPAITNITTLVFGMGGIDIVIGTIQNDLLSGGNGSVDLIIGLAGNDVLRGAGGIDLMLGLSGDDFLHGGDDMDLLLGDAVPLLAIFPNLTPGNDCLEGEDGIDFIFGEQGDDHLDGGMQPDLLVGGADDDRLFGDGHNDLMIGWTGNDILLSDAEDNQQWSNIMLGDSLFPLIEAGEDELYATLGNELSVDLGLCTLNWTFGDLMIGGDQNDLLEGADGIDIQFGNRGADTINGREHVDIQFGGRGNDIMQGHRGGTALEIIVSGVCVPIRMGNIMFGNQDLDEMHGGADMDVIFGNGENDTIHGNDGSFHLLSLENIPLLGDWIFSGKGADWVDGMAGSDKIFGGEADDVLYGDDGVLTLEFSLNPLNDIIFGNDGNDTIYGGLAPDFLFGNDGDDTIYSGTGIFDFAFGNSGNDTIYGERGVDIIFGNSDDDELHGGPGLLDFIYGNTGNDKIYGENGADLCYGNDGNDLIWGGNSIDIIWGDGIFGSQTGNDEIWGENGRDIIFGNGGDDIGHGGPGMDFMYGNTGNDCFEGNDGNDFILGNSGSDQLRGQEGKDRIWGDNTGLSAILTWLPFLNNNPGNDVIWGGSHHDRIKGGGGDDEIYGEHGNDKIWGELGLNIELASGNDTIYGGPGKDKIRGQQGNDQLYGGLDRDKMRGGRDNDLIYGGSGNDKIKGKNGNDELYGGAGDDKIKGGLGNDIIFGGIGDDKLKGKVGHDQLLGNAGNDKLRGGWGIDHLFGDAGSDRAIGGWGADIILGGTGDDPKLKGGWGSDRIHGGSGADKIKGNLDRDVLDTGNDGDEDRVIGGIGRDIIFADKGEDKIRRKRELFGNSSDNDSGIDVYVTRPTERGGSRFIYGCKWEDSNGDGIQQSHEPMVVDWPIFADLNGNFSQDPGEPATLTIADDPETWSNEEGCYCLEIPAGLTGNFTIQEALVREQYRPTFPNASGTWSVGDSFSIFEGEVFTGIDFGNAPVTTDQTIKISGRKWYDLNCDGICQEKELRYNNVIIGTLIWADYNGNGQYDRGEPFTRVEKDGTYCLTVSSKQKVGIYEQPSSNYAGIEMIHTFPIGDNPCHIVNADGSDGPCDFGNRAKEAPEDIGGTVVLDHDGDGAQSVGEVAVKRGRMVLDMNSNGVADEGEPSGLISDGSEGIPAGRFVINLDAFCFPPGIGTTLVFDDIARPLGTTLPPPRTTGTDFECLLDPNCGYEEELDRLYTVAPDQDNDGLADILETRMGTNPALQDSDGDNLDDFAEWARYRTDPAISDTDKDGIDDDDEMLIGTNPLDSDSDGDGVPDGEEVKNPRLDPTTPDTDKDGRWDGIDAVFQEFGTISGHSDPDGDGASSYQEIFVFNTNPKLADSDGDGFNDLLEGAAGYDPNSKQDNPSRSLVPPTGGALMDFLITPRDQMIQINGAFQTGNYYQIEKSYDLVNWEIVEEFQAERRLKHFSIPKGKTLMEYYRSQELPAK